jgi:hypothetical protein
MVGGTIYIRWSSEAQTGRDSLRRQLEAARRYATDHQIDVRETIIDEATSAFSGSHLTRGRLGDFLKRVEAGEVSTPHSHQLRCGELHPAALRAPRAKSRKSLSRQHPTGRSSGGLRCDRASGT